MNRKYIKSVSFIYFISADIVAQKRYKGILIIIFGIYTRCQWMIIDAQVVGNGFCSSVVEHWSSNPEDAGSIPSRKASELHFSQLVPVWVL